MNSLSLTAGFAALALQAASVAQEAWDASFPQSPGDGHNFMMGVWAGSQSSAWGVGYYHAGNDSRTFAARWDGAQWHTTPTPSPKPPGDGPATCALLAVEQIAPDHAWAAGYQTIQHPDDGVVGTQMLLMRWDGHEWATVPAPITPKGGTGAFIRDILVIAPDDIWFVGIYNFLDDEHHTGLAMHWDGAGFTLHPTPNIFPLDHRNLSISRDADGNLWIAGMAADEVLLGTFPYVIRSDARGEQWEVLGSWHEKEYRELHSIVAFTPDQAWISMARMNDNQFVGQDFLRWDGASWAITPSPDPFHGSRLAALTPDDIYSAGSDTLLHFDGHSWEVIATMQGVSQPQFFAASAAPDRSIFAVGAYRNDAFKGRNLAGLFLPGSDCYPDFTGDGALDLFDFLAYVNAFNSGDPAADCDHNAGLDLFDFLCFVNAFNAGC